MADTVDWASEQAAAPKATTKIAAVDTIQLLRDITLRTSLAKEYPRIRLPRLPRKSGAPSRGVLIYRWQQRRMGPA